jgi:hypothetical protein
LNQSLFQRFVGGANSPDSKSLTVWNLLVRAEMSMPNTTIGKSHSCGDKRCKCCKHVQHSSSYTSKVTGKQCKIFCTVNCKSANVIYILECSVCLFNDEDFHSVEILETVVR